MAMVFAFLHYYERGTLVVFWACTHKITRVVFIVTINYNNGLTYSILYEIDREIDR